MEELLELDVIADQISSGINAVGLMTMGLEEAQDPYADGFNVIWHYLVAAERDLQRYINSK